MPVVTVVTPTFQHARYIEACLRSVLAQTFEDWELIVVDDGSTDGTPDKAEAFADPRITVVRRPHAGLSGLGGAYSAALALSTAPLVSILEGDDTWPPLKLAEQVLLFEDADVVLSYGPAGLIDTHGCVYARYWRPPRGLIARNDPVGSIIPALVRGNFLVSPTVLIRRKALDAIGGFLQPEGIPYVDHPTWLKLAAIGKFAVARSVMGYWRRHPAQYTTRGLEDRAPDGSAYLNAAVADARELLEPEHWREVEASVKSDPDRQLARATVGRGRLALLNGHWAVANEIWRGLLRGGSPAIRSIALLGLGSAAAKTDVEWLFRSTGRLSWPSRRHQASHRELE